MRIPKILVVDDEFPARESLRMILGRDHKLFLASSGKQALQIVQREECDLVFLDILMPHMDGFQVLREIRKSCPHVAVVMITAVDTAKAALQAVRLGAYDYITKPFEIRQIRSVVENALSEKPQSYGVPEIIGTSQKIGEVLDVVEKVSQSNAPVLILGESGTGKELVARAIHWRGLRKDKPFVVVKTLENTSTIIVVGRSHSSAPASARSSNASWMSCCSITFRRRRISRRQKVAYL